jgi:hypothetical protein
VKSVESTYYEDENLIEIIELILIQDSDIVFTGTNYEHCSKSSECKVLGNKVMLVSA